LITAACSTTKYVEKNQFLADKIKLVCDNKEVNTDEMKQYYQQKTNRSMKMYLRFYTFARTLKWNKLANTVGEAPILLDSLAIKKTEREFLKYLKNKGFYNAEVSNTGKIKKKKAKIEYIIHAGEPFRISKIEYVPLEESNGLMDSIVKTGMEQTFLSEGKLFDVDLLQAERGRISRLLTENGFYGFSKEYVYFEVDTNIGNKKVEVMVSIKQKIHKAHDGSITQTNHKPYLIKSISFYPDFDPKKSLLQGNTYFNSLDTSHYRHAHSHIFYHERKRQFIKPKVLSTALLFDIDSLYRINDIELTYKHFSRLKVYKLTNIIFTESPLKTDKYNALDCQIQLTPLTTQSYSLELEGTNASANFGVASNFIYGHKNIFRGAENLDLKLKAAIEANRNVFSQSNKTFNTQEYGIEAKLHLPQFLLPLKAIKIKKKYAPHTTLTALYNYQQRPDYTRSVRSATFGYFWQTSDFNSHFLNVIEFNSVRLPVVNPQFMQSIIDLNMRYSYEDHLISSTNYTYLYNDQDLKKKRDFVYFKLYTESSGNLLTAANELINSQVSENIEVEGKGYKLFKTTYSQFLKTDIDFRYYRIITPATKLVYRTFVGIGVPYGNLKTLPFGKQFYSGGAYSIRGWQVRSLGPGSYKPEAENDYPNQTGDIKLEANVEYRVKLSSMFELAMFVDAGNIWTISTNETREGAHFAFDTFYKQIAVGSGLGLRFDLSFFVFRADVGFKMHDPAKPQHSRWVWNTGNKLDPQLNLGIGYPF